jgi:hypothetical protein
MRAVRPRTTGAALRMPCTTRMLRQFRLSVGSPGFCRSAFDSIWVVPDAATERIVSASNTMCWCPCYFRLLMMPMITGKTNVGPVDGPAVTDRDKQ